MCVSEPSKEIESSCSVVANPTQSAESQSQSAEDRSDNIVTDVTSSATVETPGYEEAREALGGRRIVDLFLIADRLRKGFNACKTDLRLIDCKKDVKQGLASVLHVS